MAIRYTGEVAIFEDVCRLNEAEALHQWLEKTPNGKVDLTNCRHMHTAILQQLLLAKSAVIALPADAFLAHCLSSLR